MADSGHVRRHGGCLRVEKEFKRMRESPGLLARWGSHLRWLLFAALVCAAGLVIGRQFIFARVDEEIRVRLESIFASHYRDMEVRIQAARRIEGQGIEIRGLSIRSQFGSTDQRQLLSIDELFLDCRTELSDLWLGHPQVRRLVVRRMKVRAICTQQGHWNVASLLPLPDLGGSVPLVELEDSTVEVQDLCRRAGQAWALRNIGLRAQLRADAQGSPQWQFSGTLLGDHFKRVQVRGTLDAERGAWSAWGTLDGLEMSQSMLNALPGDIAPYASGLASLRARAHFEFRVGHEPDDAEPLRWVVHGHVSEGRLDDPQLPLSLSDLEADVYVDNGQLRIENVTARSGPTVLELTCHCQDFLTATPRVHLVTLLRQVQLDEQLYRALPAAWREEWDKFSPAGVVDAAVELQLRDGRLIPHVTVNCRDVSFAYAVFPLRLRQGTGVLQLAGNRLEVKDFSAVAGNQKVHFSGAFENLGPQATGALELWSAGPVALEHELIAAMTPAGQALVNSLHPVGGLTLTRGRIEKDQPGAEPRSRWELELNDCSIRYDRFPYDIHRISGQVVLDNGRWDFIGLQGQHGSNQLVCHGSWIPETPDIPEAVLTLQFDCRDVPLNDALRGAVGQLSPPTQRFWDSLRPRGTIDRLQVAVAYGARSRQLDLTVGAEKRSAEGNVESRSISLYPSWLPLRLEDCTGNVQFSRGAFQLDNVSARCGASRVELTGAGRVHPDLQWEVSLSRLNADAMRVDHELIDALPVTLRPALRQLKYRGVLSLNGNGWLRGRAEQAQQAGWDVLLDIENGALDNAMKLEHIHGGIRLTGTKDTQGFQSHGVMEIDSLLTRGLQVTQIEGPLWMDSQQLLLGSGASRARRGAVPRQITARAMGGQLAVDAHIAFDDPLRFGADISLDDASVGDFVRTLHAERHDIAGKVYGILRLQGTQAGLHTLQGSGQLRLRQADIYQLPVMMSLLNVLSLRPPDTTAFTSGDVDFRLQGEQMFLDRVEFMGDAITLKGNGWMDLNRRIKLDCYALVGREELQLPVIRTLLAEASKSILLIQIVGDVNSPQVIRKPLPELDDTLQRLFPEAAPRAARR